MTQDRIVPIVKPEEIEPGQKYLVVSKGASTHMFVDALAQENMWGEIYFRDPVDGSHRFLTTRGKDDELRIAKDYAVFPQPQ